MQTFANEGSMIPEQVWDMKETPKQPLEFSPELKFGEGTGSATPLAWSMAQFIRLAVNLKAGRNLETPQVVYDRYVKGNSLNADFTEIPETFQKGADFSDICFSQNGPSYRKDCSYVSTLMDSEMQNPALRKCSLDGFYLGCKNNATEMHACFSFKGDFKTLEIAGDFTNWKPVALDVRRKSEGVFAPCFNFAKTARVEYKLIVDGKWIIDPLNPNKVDNGVGGENSFFTMPEYKPTKWDKGEAPTLDEFEITSKDFGTRTIKVYAPQNISTTKKRGITTSSLKNVQPLATAAGTGTLPVLYVEDGSDYVTRAKAIRIQLNLVKAGEVRPFIMVFIDPKDRMKEYWANDQWTDFIANEVVPEIDKRYRTIKNRDGRALLGTSLGGVTSIWTALKHPDIFARVGGQSSSFWIDNERVVKTLENLDSKIKFKFYLDDGTLEGVDDSRKVARILSNKGFDVTYYEAEAGHNWTAWRDRLAGAFVALWK